MTMKIFIGLTMNGCLFIYTDFMAKDPSKPNSTSTKTINFLLNESRYLYNIVFFHQKLENTYNITDIINFITNKKVVYISL